MKRILSIIISAIMIAMLASCAASSTTEPESYSAVDTDTDITEPVVDQNITAEEATGDFELTTADGEFSVSGNIYTITAEGTYTATGLLEGQIIIDAEETDEVVLELSGATITYENDSPVKILSAGSVDVSAKRIRKTS